MEEKETVAVEMTAEQYAEYEAMKAQLEESKAAQKAKDDRVAYAQLVDDTIECAIPELMSVSDDIKFIKKWVFDEFKGVLDMKALVIPRKAKSDDGQRSHTFTNSKGDKRITLGVYLIDGYRDTVEDGIAIVREELEKLGTNDESKALVNMVLRLLAKDVKGTLKASRIVQLRRTASDIGNKRILEGVAIIEESYQPTVSKQFIRAEVKNEIGAWVSIPLGMTEA